MTALQTLCLFATGYLVSRLLLAAELHHDVTTRLLRLSRGRVSRVVLGVMFLSFVLSTVVPNALTVLALLPLLTRLRQQAAAAREAGSEAGPGQPAEAASGEPPLYGTLLAMALIYGANLGGVGSLLGSPANLYLLVNLRIYDVPGRDALHFLSWLAFGLPMALALVGLFWGVLWLTARSGMAARLPREGLPALPDPQAAAVTLAARRRHLALRFVLAWIAGWTALLGAGLLAGLGKPAGAPATPVLLSGTLLGQPVALELLDAVALGASLAFVALLLGWPVGDGAGRQRLLPLSDLHREVPWRGLLVAAVVLAALVLVAQSGAVGWLRNHVPALLPEVRSPFLVSLILVTVTIFATEVLNNTTVSTVMFPVAAVTAPALGADPLMAMLGVSLASTCAFMTPVATPVNALALASLRGVSLGRFLWCGLWVNLVAAASISIFVTWVVPPVLGLFGGA